MLDIIPAIDLLDGRCVRLIQGRYDRVIDYQEDPLVVAKRFRDAGASWVHVIDLDGARQGSVANLDTLHRIVTESGLKVQFGGGVRDDASIQAALDAGASRVILGTRALDDWEGFKASVHTPEWADRLALGMDAKLGKLVSENWTKDTERSAVAVAEQLTGWPLSSIIYTDIARDGLMLGPNLEAIRVMANASPVPVIYSGGVTELEDVKAIAGRNIIGVVIGRAIYEGVIDLAEAIQLGQSLPDE